MASQQNHWDTPRPSKGQSCSKVTKPSDQTSASWTSESEKKDPIDKIVRNHSDAKCEESLTGRRFLKDRRQLRPSEDTARGSRSFPWENVHLSRPATPQSTQHKGKEGDNPCIELDMSRMAKVIAEMEQTFAHVESARLSVENRKCETSNHLWQIPAFVRTLLKRLYCLRDVYRLGTERVFASEAKQDAFFQNLLKVCNIVDANMSTDGALVSDYLGQIIRTTLYGVIDNFKENLPDRIHDMIEKRAQSALCPEPRYAVVKRATTGHIAPHTTCISSSQTGDPAANKCTTSANEICDTAPPAPSDETRSKPKIKWPLLHTTDLETQKKDEKLHSLMAEIDSLLEDVGLSDRRTDGLTYEVIMGTDTAREPEERRPEKRKIPRDLFVAPASRDLVATKASRDKVPEIRESVRAQTSAANSRVNKPRKATKEQFTDTFSEELDKLLNDC